MPRCYSFSRPCTWKVESPSLDIVTATVMGGLINLTWGLSVRLWLGCGLRLARVQCKEGR